MKILTAAQMREVDRRTTELGIPGLVLMENAGQRVVELLAEVYGPLENRRIAVVCGKGNNGGDGLVVARQLHTRFRPRALDVVLAGDAKELRGDAAQNFRMLEAVGCPVRTEIAPGMQAATIIVDALLGTGLRGAAEGRALHFIQAINEEFPLAEVVSIDVPSGMDSDSGVLPGECVRADYTVTFTAPKLCHALGPAYEYCGKLKVAAIGSPPDLFDKDDSIYLALSEPALFRHLFQPRAQASNKGVYGHVLAIAGARGKTGAAAIAAAAALRAGAGLVTVASAHSAIDAIASFAPEIMTEPLPETEDGSISLGAFEQGLLARVAEKKNVIAIGPGLGGNSETVQAIRRMAEEFEQPMVLDADALNALARWGAGLDLRGRGARILTPHPGEMARLISCGVREVQADRIGAARSFARQRGVYLALKGDRTVIAAPDGRVWINPTGSPALATGGTGDALTGMIAGLLAQFPDQPEAAALAAVYLHGRAGELGAAALGEKTFIATDLFRFLPEAIREIAS